MCCSGAAATDRTGQAFAEADDAQSQPSTLRAAAHCAGMTCYFSGVAARLTGEEREDVGSHQAAIATAASARMAPTRPHPRTSRTWCPVTPWRASSQFRQAVELVTLVMAGPPMTRLAARTRAYIHEKCALSKRTHRTSRPLGAVKPILLQFQLRCILVGKPGPWCEQARSFVPNPRISQPITSAGTPFDCAGNRATDRPPIAVCELCNSQHPHPGQC